MTGRSMRHKRPLFSWREGILESGLPPTTRHVLLTLSCHMNDLGESCFPSTRLLSHETGLSERAVVTHLRKARDAGWLQVDPVGLGGQRWRKHQYTVAIPEGDERGASPFDCGAGQPDDEGTEPRASPSGPPPVDNPVDKSTEAAEPHAEGAEPDDRKALNEVQSNSSVNSTKNSTGGAPTRSPDDVYVKIPLKSDREYAITVAAMTELAGRYPRVDVPEQLQRLASWCERNLERRKASDEIEGFVERWLERAQTQQIEQRHKAAARQGRIGPPQPQPITEHIASLRRACNGEEVPQ